MVITVQLAQCNIVTVVTGLVKYLPSLLANPLAVRGPRDGDEHIAQKKGATSAVGVACLGHRTGVAGRGRAQIGDGGGDVGAGREQFDNCRYAERACEDATELDVTDRRKGTAKGIRIETPSDAVFDPPITPAAF